MSSTEPVIALHSRCAGGAAIRPSRRNFVVAATRYGPRATLRMTQGIACGALVACAVASHPAHALSGGTLTPPVSPTGELEREAGESNEQKFADSMNNPGLGAARDPATDKSSAVTVNPGAAAAATPPTPDNPIGPDTARAPESRRMKFVWVTIGDSYASGEGNPVSSGAFKADFKRIRPPTWGYGLSGRWLEDTPVAFGRAERQACHRSEEAGAAKAHRRLQERYPFIDFEFANLACSAARIRHLMEDVTTVGDRYVRVEESAQAARAAEFAQHHGDFDALVLSIGGNDARFPAIVKACVQPSLQDCSAEDLLIEDNELAERPLHPVPFFLDRLPERYAALDDYIHSPERPVTPRDILITAYPNPMTNGDGEPCDGGEGNADWDLLSGASRSETLWAEEFVLGDEGRPGTLNDSVYGTQALGWRVIDGHLPGFLGRGYCSQSNAINTNHEARQRQGDDLDFQFVPLLPQFGAISAGLLHPNDSGYVLYGHAIAEAIQELVDVKIESHLVPPANIRIADVVPNGDITVRWDDVSDVEDFYEVWIYPVGTAGYRVVGEGAESVRLAANAQSHVFDSRSAEMAEFEVRTCRDDLCSAPARVVGANYPPDSPTILGVEYESDGTLKGRQILLDWRRPDRASTHYVVEYRNLSDGTGADRTMVVEGSTKFALGIIPAPAKEVLTTPSNTLPKHSSATITLPQEGEAPAGVEGTYRFRVAACHRGGCSPFTEYVQIDAAGLL